MLTANIEGDELLMKVATSISKKDYKISFLKNGKVTSSILDNRRNNKKDIIKKLNKLNKVEGKDYILELITIVSNFDLGCYLINKELLKIMHLTKCDNINIYLGPTNKSNFRFKSAITQPYKSNRPSKPEIIFRLRDYLILIKGAIVIEGYEADDALGIYQKYDDSTIAVHCDKDIFMIPGLHFNTMKNNSIKIDELGNLYISDKSKVTGSGLAFFYYQLIVGDTTDTIPSLKKGFGPVKAYNALCSCTNEKEYMQSVIGLYEHYIENNWNKRLLEQADLVWICRNKKEKGKDYLLRRSNELGVPLSC